jgi:hypothetical protein
MTVGQRLRKFIETCYGSQKIFSDSLNIKETVLSRYTGDRNFPGFDLLVKFKSLGLSIDWLLDGSGNMITPEFEDQFTTSKVNRILGDSMKTPFERIQFFIEWNYGSLEKFAIVVNRDIAILEDALVNNFVPDTDIVEMMDRAGCNVSWLASGKGSPYANNIQGILLKMKREGRELSHNEIELLKQINFNPAKNYKNEEIFEFISILSKTDEREAK